MHWHIFVKHCLLAIRVVKVDCLAGHPTDAMEDSCVFSHRIPRHTKAGVSGAFAVFALLKLLPVGIQYSGWVHRLR